GTLFQNVDWLLNKPGASFPALIGEVFAVARLKNPFSRPKSINTARHVRCAKGFGVFYRQQAEEYSGERSGSDESSGQGTTDHPTRVLQRPVIDFNGGDAGSPKRNRNRGRARVHGCLS